MQNRTPLPLNQSRLFKVTSPGKLAKALGLTNEALDTLIAKSNDYHEFELKKKDGGKRHVEHPGERLKAVQRKIARHSRRYRPSRLSFLPREGSLLCVERSIAPNNRVIRCLDIRKFFPSTPSRRVFWFFHKLMKCREDVASILTILLTYQGRLPTGSPHSPIVAYFAYYDLWAAMDVFCKERGYTLTIYIDDVTISGPKVPTSDIWAIKQMIHRYGLRYHKEKTFIDRPAEITGVIVADGKLCVPNRQHQKCYRARRKSLGSSGDPRALRGRMAGLEGQMRQIVRHNLNAQVVSSLAEPPVPAQA